MGRFGPGVWAVLDLEYGLFWFMGHFGHFPIQILSSRGVWPLHHIFHIFQALKVGESQPNCLPHFDPCTPKPI